MERSANNIKEDNKINKLSRGGTIPSIGTHFPSCITKLHFIYVYVAHGVKPFLRLFAPN